MAVTVQKVATIARFIGLAADDKPTGVPVGSTYYAYDTGALYITQDGGATWSLKDVRQYDDTDKLAVSLYGKGVAAGDVAVDVDADGHLQLDVLSSPTGASATQVQGTAAEGAAVVGSPVRIGGKDGAGNTQDIITDTDGHPQVDVLSDVVAGATTDAPFVGVETATARAGISLWKGIKNTLYDALGVAADAIVAAGAVGSISAKLRRATQGLEDLKTMIVLAAGTAVIGKVDSAISTPTIYNVTCTNADTEYSQALPANCRFLEFQARTEAVIRFAFETGKVAGPASPYMTLKAGDYYASPMIGQGLAPSTLYVASPTAGVVVELLAWT